MVKERKLQTRTVKAKGLLNRLKKRTIVLKKYKQDDTWYSEIENGK